MGAASNTIWIALLILTSLSSCACFSKGLPEIVNIFMEFCYYLMRLLKNELRNMWKRAEMMILEPCDNNNIRLDSDGLRGELTTRLYGQHLASSTVLKAVKYHVGDENPKKPLVLSFNGRSGTGKHYVSRMITRNLYKKKENSFYVHYFTAVNDFKDPTKVMIYKEELLSKIREMGRCCERSLFIFDEMDKMPAGLVDVLVPFLGHNIHGDGVNFRKSIFIFLSNTGEKNITQALLRHMKNGGVRRELKLRDMQKVLMESVYKEQNGLKESKLVENNLIDHFVPFLPLERKHVRLCLQDELNRRYLQLKESEIEEVLDELTWFSKYFAVSGCKKVDHKIALVKDEL